jgi:hypothetical protein
LCKNLIFVDVLLAIALKSHFSPLAAWNRRCAMNHVEPGLILLSSFCSITFPFHSRHIFVIIRWSANVMELLRAASAQSSTALKMESIAFVRLMVARASSGIQRN